MNVVYRLWTHPVVIGSGQRLAREGNDTCGLRLLDRRAFDADVVVLTYQPAQFADDEAGSLVEDRRPAHEPSLTKLALAMLGVTDDEHAAQDDDRQIAFAMLPEERH